VVVVTPQRIEFTPPGGFTNYTPSLASTGAAAGKLHVFTYRATDMNAVQAAFSFVVYKP